MRKPIEVCLHLIFTCVMLTSCVHKTRPTSSTAMNDLPSALAHGAIEPIVDNVFSVMGSNIIVHDGLRIQASRTMTIIRENHELTLINSMRLTDAGLQELAKLGRIKNVIRLGAFHGRDDAFYQQAFGAQLWAFPQMEFSHGEVVDHDLNSGRLPISHARLIDLKTTKFKEALLLVEKDGGILISCDSIKNWQEEDRFFDDQTFTMMTASGSIGAATIDATWLGAMNPSTAEISALADLPFSILASAHGKPLTKNAKSALKASSREAIMLLQKLPGNKS